jgi:type IV pilus assembly protein PilB
MYDTAPVGWLDEVENLTKVFTSVELARHGGDQRASGPGAAEDEPAVKLVDALLRQAVREGASDVHITPAGNETLVRFRVDGALHDATRLPGAIAAALISRIKTLARMKIVETRRPQDGQLVFEVDGRSVDVRVATIALVDGETCGLRILDKAKALLSLDELGMPAATLASYREVAHAHGGMVLAAGPTGSGKTTTLYATFGEILDASLNVMTIEDPVEYVFPHFNQIQVNEPTGVDFYAGLRTILRLDPDLILVGEIRDQQTAQVSVQAALSGHFVGSTIHARDAAAALLRMINLGVEPFLLVDSLRAVVAQRLVRRICDNCKESYELSPAERLFVEERLPEKDTFFTGLGCHACAGTGFHDRVGIYELLRVSAEIARLVAHGGEQETLRSTAIEQGMMTLEQGALEVVRSDITTPSEIIRKVFTR